MNYWKEINIDRQNGWPEDEDRDLTEFARILGGEIDGKLIACPGPGRPAHDRSCFVKIDRRGQPYIYDCEGSQGAAYAFIRRKLRLSTALPSRDNSAHALSILAETVPISGTVAEDYLRSRSITLPLASSLRFHPHLRHTSARNYLPAMVAERTSVDGIIVACHRTYLRHDGSRKANVDPPRMDLGPAAGTAIRLSPVADELMIGEGIETTFSAMQMYGLPGWAAGSAIAMRKLALPESVRSVIIVADGDQAGEAAARYAGQRLLHEGRRVRLLPAPQGLDFNDVLVARGAVS